VGGRKKNPALSAASCRSGLTSDRKKKKKAPKKKNGDYKGVRRKWFRA